MRVVALSADPTLAVALTMMDGWEIADAADIEDVARRAPGSSVVLIGVGGTEEGLTLAEDLSERGITIPVVVVGDKPAVDDRGVPVLSRPFSLDDIATAVESAVRARVPDGQTMMPASAPHEEPAVADTEPRIVTPQRPVIKQHPMARPRAEDAAPATALEPRSEVRALLEAPAASNDPADLSSPLVDDHPVDVQIGDPDPAVSPAFDDVEPNEPVALEPALAEAQRGLPPIPEEAVVRPEAPPALEPPPVESAPVQPPAVAPPPRVAPQPPVQPVQASRVIAPAAKSTPRRRFGRRRTVDEPVAEAPSGLPLEVRLKAAILALADIEALFEDLPMLGDLHAMASVVLDEMTATLRLETAFVLVEQRDGFRVLASLELSSVERSMLVPSDQPLIQELRKTLEAIHIAPVDLARGLVAGMPGARREALIVAPVHYESECIAVLGAGADAFSDADLERLDALAREAALGLALTHTLDALRSPRR